ncbi:MAG: hypothetical protein KDI66_10960 [Xanthomonadales bacterium]|nr:hypothetical protein [Xanthomonadales bacterium]
MKRRHILVAGSLAAAGAVAWARDPVIALTQNTRALPLGDSRMAAALLPVELSPYSGTRVANRVEVIGFLPAELSSGVSRLDFDIQLVDPLTGLRTIYAWQARRLGQGLISAAGNLRMEFDSSLGKNAVVTVLDERGMARTLSSSLPANGLLALVTPRRSTAAPPSIDQLRYDPIKKEMRLVSGERRDFETLLIRTS